MEKSNSQLPFVHLHVHTEYSLLDGACRIRPLLEMAKAQGSPALAITDHGVMYGVVDFYHAAAAVGVKPILGCEVYLAPRSRFDRTPGVDDNLEHVTLLAASSRGYQNLSTLVTKASLEGFYRKPRVDLELLGEYSQDLVCLSGCLAGPVAKAILGGVSGEITAAGRRRAGELMEIFGRENFYLELQDHGLPAQKAVNRALVELGHRLDLELVVTNDVHYIRGEDAALHDVLLCIQTGKTLDDPGRLRFGTEQFYLKNAREMQVLFSELPRALSNTLVIAERLDVRLEFGKLRLPQYPLPEGQTEEGYLRKLVLEGAERRYGECWKQPGSAMKERLEYELSTITQMGFCGYFLIVWDMIHFARSTGIAVGPGRGSAAGSLVAYCLGITEIDPLAHGLLFERFLNPERVTMPDIDTDFCFVRRGEVIDYLVSRYTEANVAQIITFGTMAARAAVRDVGRVMSIPLGEVDRVAKLVPPDPGMTIRRALEIEPRLRDIYESSNQMRVLVDTASALEGTPRHASTHAAGLVIADRPLVEYLPMQKLSDAGVVTQFPMHTIEDLGLLKMDILGLRTLTVISDCLDLMAQKEGIRLDLANLPLDDPLVYEMLGRGETTGVFQLESEGMRSILRGLRPERFADLVALVALYRPGPLGSGMIDDFIQRKHDPETIQYRHPMLEPILNDTYGVILYQEQVMRIAGDMAGFSLGQADILRRAMGKKKPEVLAAQRAAFLEGAAGRGINTDIAGEIFELMEHFSGYGFNKSHSVAYALVAYRTAYLKAHSQVEFMAALLTSVMEHQDKVPSFIAECRRLGIEILPPDVNESSIDFTVVGNSIRFGLAAIKNVGRGTIEAIIAAREKGGPFCSLSDFCRRVELRLINKRTIECLVRCGAFSSLQATRSQLLAVSDTCLAEGAMVQEDQARGQLSLLDMLTAGNSGTSGSAVDPVFRCSSQPEQVLPNLPELHLEEILRDEKELLGFYISGHPLDSYREQLAKLGVRSLAELSEGIGEQVIRVAGIIAGLRRMVTKNGEGMAYATLEDISGSCELVVFPKVLVGSGQLLEVGQAVFVKGKVNAEVQGERVRMLVEELQDLRQVREVKPGKAFPGPTSGCEREGRPPGRKTVGPRPYSDYSLPPPARQKVRSTNTNTGIAPRQRVFIKVGRKTSLLFRQVLAIVGRYPGSTPAVLFFPEEKQIRELEPLVSPSQGLVTDLEQLLGPGAVKIAEL